MSFSAAVGESSLASLAPVPVQVEKSALDDLDELEQICEPGSPKVANRAAFGDTGSASKTVQLEQLEEVLAKMFDTMRVQLNEEFKATLKESLEKHGAGLADGQVEHDSPMDMQRTGSADLMDEITELFHMIDKDGTGSLQKAEIIRAFKVNWDVVAFCRRHARLAPLANPKTFGETFAKMDADGSNTIDLDEFKEALRHVSVAPVGRRSTLGPADDEVTELFIMMDIMAHGSLTKDECVKALKMNHVVISFCRQHPALNQLLNPVTFKNAFAQVEGYDAKSINETQLRQAVNIIKRKDRPEGDLPGTVVDDEGNPRDSGLFSLIEDGKGAWEIPETKADMFGGGAQLSELDEVVYDVSQFYWKEGCSQAIARSDWFINTTLGVISANALYLGIDADHNKASLLLDADVIFILCEYLFCAYFTFEWVVRFCAFKSKRDCIKDGWFKFDSILVLLMLLETCLMPFVFPIISDGGSPPPTGPLRLLRLLRLSRLIRLLRSLPELVIIIKGMAAAFRAVGSSLMMVAILVYVFAIVMHMFLKDDPTEDADQFFATLPRCMWTLLIHGTFLDDIATVLGMLAFRSDFNALAALGFFMVFILMTALTVMNMLIGVLCEVVSAVAANEKEEAAINVMRHTILVELKKFDDGDGLIDEDELNELMADPGAVGVFDSLGIDVPFLQELQVMTFQEEVGESIPMKRIIEQMLTCRRDLPCTVNHLVMQQKLSQWQTMNTIVQMEERMKRKMGRSSKK